MSKDDIVDFTPELHAQALKNLAKFRWEQTPYVPPTGPESPLLGSINIANTTGNVNWPGSGFDPETGIFYTHAHNSAVTIGHYDQEEFEKVNPERKGPRLPRWEAEPNYGLPRAPGTAPAAGAGVPRPERPPGAQRGPRRHSDRQAAVRRDVGDRRQQGRPDLAGAARRHARPDPQPSRC